jgi:ATPase family associated with various cellular activities (AAA)
VSDDVYRDNLEHIADELRRLDLLIQLRICSLRLRNKEFADEQISRTVYISEQEVEWLLAPEADEPVADTIVDDAHAKLVALSAEIDGRVERSLRQGIRLALPTLGRLFGLSKIEQQIVLMCLAPELRRRYDRLYAYLQDDITRTRPSIHLVAELLSSDEKLRWQASAYLSESAPLLRTGLLRRIDDPNSPSGSTRLAQFIALDPRICEFLLGMGVARQSMPSGTAAAPVADPVLVDGLVRLAKHHRGTNACDRKLVLYLHGAAGVGKRELAREVCNRLGVSLLSLSADSLGAEPERTLRLHLREGLLQHAAVQVVDADVLARGENHTLLTVLSTAVADFGWLVFLIGESDWSGGDELAGIVVHSVEVMLPDVPRSAAIWRYSLAGHVADPEEWADELAGRFRLPAARITAAVELADNYRVIRHETQTLTLADVAAACRQQSNQKLGERAVKVQPVCGWDDLVLPEDRVAQLRDICAQVRHHYRVYVGWGFGAKLSRGKGISALFSGPSGTGKTVAAEVLAHDLQLDLYKVDLSGVVSKYIGETEKNLAKIFAEAETGNAILFFDEADALFGKRTEVSDAHDRYANIETSYLLQRIEHYEGVVILATNLRQNMDEAFTRRIRFIVEFPFPEADSRLRIWRTLFPPQAPVSADLDLGLLARQLPVAGGSIKNIVLHAAFLAAADGGVIDRRHVLRGARLEFEKIGKLWNDVSALGDHAGIG